MNRPPVGCTTELIVAVLPLYVPVPRNHACSVPAGLNANHAARRRLFGRTSTSSPWPLCAGSYQAPVITGADGSWRKDAVELRAIETAPRARASGNQDLPIQQERCGVINARCLEFAGVAPERAAYIVSLRALDNSTGTLRV